MTARQPLFSTRWYHLAVTEASTSCESRTTARNTDLEVTRRHHHDTHTHQQPAESVPSLPSLADRLTHLPTRSVPRSLVLAANCRWLLRTSGVRPFSDT